VVENCQRRGIAGGVASTARGTREVGVADAAQAEAELTSYFFRPGVPVTNGALPARICDANDRVTYPLPREEVTGQGTVIDCYLRALDTVSYLQRLALSLQRPVSYLQRLELSFRRPL
jgi:hypothetical protein